MKKKKVQKTSMKILAIETSCDETGLSILECKGGIKNPSFKVLGNKLSSQAKLHSAYGGVYPTLAKREHQKNLPILLEKVLKTAKLPHRQDLWGSNKSVVDMIAVTSGPGLEPALWTGIVFAKELAKKWSVPLVPVNHMEGHVLSVFGKQKGEFSIPKIKFPALSLLVSGGHTELVLVKDFQKYKVIGETLDDAAGEAFDKVARMMSLPYPGGPEISKLAEEERKRTMLRSEFTGSHHAYPPAGGLLFSPRQSAKRFAPANSNYAISLPRPMMYSKNFDFSFSGLKTAVLYLIRKIGKLDEKTKKTIALEFENAVVETLVYKTKKALEEYRAQTLIIAGGVAGNKHLQRIIKKEVGKKINILFPGHGLATDNSIMIGMVGYLKFLRKGEKLGDPKNIKADGSLKL